ncbi:histidinol-phosphatase [Salinibacterium sp. dk2585]|uniref:histidinol-phosphatase n=1 Tax=unclassified Salinibacterium TaxID=2632331 RepID=UPI0011C24B79|nr:MULTISPECIES: histidinol-phosphatase [unclassified Salinibacterium]QEE61809.1 histidinol-phosphatase [Salinibacterium sp. dk2585]TXK54636.1 histidinol-phosphatase [Salinibacterium sp. dk5596]
MSDDLDLAQRLADAADAVSAARFRSSDLVVTTKPDMTPVSDADRAAEEAIRAMLASERPDDSILGEEFGTSGDSRRQWIVDPIDGTSNFVRGVPVWATLIALAVDGVPVLGVVSAPALGKRWWAERSEGAFVRDAESPEGRRLQVSKVAALADASISYNSIQQWDWHGRLDELVALSRAVWRTRAYGDMWSYMMVAEGLIDVAGEFDLQPYDMAALVPIIEEAGGTFTSADGEPGPWHGSALASNGLLHEAVLDIIARR